MRFWELIQDQHHEPVLRDDWEERVIQCGCKVLILHLEKEVKGAVIDVMVAETVTVVLVT